MSPSSRACRVRSSPAYTRATSCVVAVLLRVLECNGQVYRSLSAVTKAITGTHWNGYHFFRLGKKGGNGRE